MSDNAVIAKTEQYYMPVFSRCPVVLEYGQGCYLYDDQGKKYLDVLAGIAVNALGYNHPVINEAITKQMSKLIHTSNIFYTKVQADLVEKLAEISGLDKVFLSNSGAEANEGAIKLARKYGNSVSAQKNKIISAKHSFHGRTLATLMATGQEKYQQGYQPLPEGFVYVEFGDINELKAAISDDVCAVMLEVIQGESGVNVADKAYFETVRQLCDEHKALLIFDEVQTGLCRTGKMFAHELIGIKPDIMTLAKALGAGYPIGAFLATDTVAHNFHPGDHGSTYGGNPLGCAVALAVLSYMQDEDLAKQCEQKGEYLQGKLKELAQKYPDAILTIRGSGLLIGVALKLEGKALAEKALANGLIVNIAGNNTLRIAPPLIISYPEMDELIAILDKVLGELSK